MHAIPSWCVRASCVRPVRAAALTSAGSAQFAASVYTRHVSMAYAKLCNMSTWCLVAVAWVVRQVHKSTPAIGGVPHRMYSVSTPAFCNLQYFQVLLCWARVSVLRAVCVRNQVVQPV